MRSKTILRGIAKSRKGSPSIGLQTLIDRTQRVKAAEAVVTREEAREAKKILKTKKSPLRHLDSGAVSGLANPLIMAAGRGVEAGIDAKKGHWGAARKALMKTTRGGVVKNVAQGTLFGAGISAARDSVATVRAKATYDDFLSQTGKTAGVEAGLEKALEFVRKHNRKVNTAADAAEDVTRYADGLTRSLATPSTAKTVSERDRREKAAAESLVELSKLAFGSPSAASGGTGAASSAAPRMPSVPNMPTPKTSLSAGASRAAQRTGKFNGMATSRTMTPPGIGMTKRLRPKGLAINPKRSIADAIHAFR